MQMKFAARHSAEIDQNLLSVPGIPPAGSLIWELQTVQPLRGSLLCYRDQQTISKNPHSWLVCTRPLQLHCDSSFAFV